MLPVESLDLKMEPSFTPLLSMTSSVSGRRYGHNELPPERPSLSLRELRLPFIYLATAIVPLGNWVRRLFSD